MTSTIALLGHPVSHSISPRFQQAALDALGIDARYEAWDTPPEDLPSALERLRSRDLLGANVTVPLKQEALRLIDRPDALAERIGAVNTIVNAGGVLEATNTDVAGVLRSLEDGGVDLAGANVVLIGAGGAARAIVVAMREGGAARVTIANRTAARARALVPLGGEDLELRVIPLDHASEQLRAAMQSARLVVQATSLGMRDGPDEDASPLPAELFHAGQAALDIVYVPEQTPFLRAARQGGALPLGGLSMLVHQGAESFRRWTGQPPPLDVMFDAARAALDETS